MTDIAQLGLSIDSRQVVGAKKALDDLTASAKPAAAAAASVEKAAAGAGKGAAQLASGTGLARHEMVNLSRQLQDVGVSLASGQSPFTVLVQQGVQVADIFGSSKTGTVGGAIKQIVNYIGPMRLLGLGLAGVAAGGLIAVNSISNSAKALDDVSRAAGTTIGHLHGLQTAANFKGITDDDFLKSMSKFSDDVYRAQNGMGGLADLFRANNVQAKTFNDYLFRVADLIRNAKDDQQRLQLLQQAGLPATMQWVRFLSQGADGIKEAIKAAGDFNETAATKMIARAREFDEAWDKATTNIGNKFKGWLMGLDEATFSLLAKVQQLAQNSYGSGAAAPKRIDITGGTTAPATAMPVDPQVMQRNIALQQQALGIYGQTVTALEAVRQVELQVQSARANGVALDEKRVEVLKRLASEQTIGVTAIKAGTDAANIDAAVVGMSVENATRYAAAQNALNEARRVGRELTPENITQIQREAAALGQAAGQADLLRFSYTNLVQGPLQTFTSAISGGASAWDAFKKAGQNALNSIASKLMEMAAQNLWSSAFGGGGGFSLAGLFGGGGVMSGTGLGAGTGGMSFPMFASGTNSAPGGWSIVGEKGPELMNVPRGAQILPNGVSPPGGGAQSSTHVTVGVSVDNDGNLQAYVKNVAQGEASRTVSGFAKSSAFVDSVGAATGKARARRLTR